LVFDFFSPGFSGVANAEEEASEDIDSFATEAVEAGMVGDGEVFKLVDVSDSLLFKLNPGSCAVDDS
jgi:hypothetical protein